MSHELTTDDAWAVKLNGCPGFIGRATSDHLAPLYFPDDEWTWLIEVRCHQDKYDTYYSEISHVVWTWTMYFVTHYGVEEYRHSGLRTYKRATATYFSASDALQAARSFASSFAVKPLW